MKINETNITPKEIHTEQRYSDSDHAKKPYLSLIDLLSRTYNVSYRLSNKASRSVSKIEQAQKTNHIAAGQLDL